MSFPSRCFFLGELVIAWHALSFFGPTECAVSSPFVPCCSANLCSSSRPLVYTLIDNLSAIDFAAVNRTSSISPLSPNHRQPVPLGPGFLPGNSMSSEPPPAGRISPEKPRAGTGGGGNRSPVTHRGPKGRGGLGPFQSSWAENLSHIVGRSEQSHLLISIRFNSYSIQIKLKFLKFIGI
jgi:hypothetical protein